jgi:predicted ArsR family transcriptional regulator
MGNNTLEEVQFQKLVWLNKFHTIDKIDLLKALKENFGQAVVDVVEKTECKKAQLEWQNISKQCTDHSIQSLIQLLWEPLRIKGFEFTSQEVSGGIQMKCTKCPVFEMAKEISGTEWLYHHTCCADPYIASGFNPQIGLKRTLTLMQGDAYCDHFYFYKES